MAAHVDPLVVGRVIGDVVDLFVPTVAMSVRFGTKDLTNGCDIKPSIAADAPAVQIAGRGDDLFTLVSKVPISLRVLLLLDGLLKNYYAMVLLTAARAVFIRDQVMTDPDAPSPSEPSMREWLHW